MGGADCAFSLRYLEVDWVFLLESMLGVICVSVILEALFHYLETRLSEHGHHLQILRRAFKELVILSILTFVLMIIRDSLVLQANQFVTLEFAHLWIFSVGFVFSIQAFSIMSMVRGVKAQWDQVILLGPAVALRRHEISKVMRQQRVFKLPELPQVFKWMFGERQVITNLEILVLKRLFSQSLSLPSSFDFAKYLRRHLSNHIAHDVDIGWHSWSILAGLMTAMLVVALQWGLTATAIEPRTALLFCNFFGWATFILCGLLDAVLRRCRTKLLYIAGVSSKADLIHAVTEMRDLEKMGPESDFYYADISKADDFHKHDNVPASGIATSAVPEHYSVPRLSAGEYKREISPRALFERAQASSHALREVYPAKNPAIILWAFEFTLLLQCFTVGLVILLCTQFYFGEVEDLLLLIASLLPHFILFFILSPSVIHNWSLLEAVCIVDKAGVNIVLQVLKLQEETRELARGFSIALYEAFVARLKMVVHHKNIGLPLPPLNQTVLRTFQEGKHRRKSGKYGWGAGSSMPSSAASMSGRSASDSVSVSIFSSAGLKRTQTSLLYNVLQSRSEGVDEVEKVLNELYSVIDLRGNHTVSPDEFRSALAKDPFRFKISAKQSRQLLRGLNSSRGFTVQRFYDIAHAAFKSLEATEIEDDSTETPIPQTVRTCFDQQDVLCRNCELMVPAIEMTKHAKYCCMQTAEERGEESEGLLHTVNTLVAEVQQQHQGKGHAHDRDNKPMILQPLRWGLKEEHKRQFKRLRDTQPFEDPSRSADNLDVSDMSISVTGSVAAAARPQADSSYTVDGSTFETGSELAGYRPGPH